MKITEIACPTDGLQMNNSNVEDNAMCYHGPAVEDKRTRSADGLLSKFKGAVAAGEHKNQAQNRKGITLTLSAIMILLLNKLN